jgi:hypothetical protein
LNWSYPLAIFFIFKHYPFKEETSFAYLKKSNLPNLVAPKKPMGRGEGPTTPMDFGQVSQYFLNGKFSPQKSLEKELSWVLKDTHTHTKSKLYSHPSRTYSRFFKL